MAACGFTCILTMFIARLRYTIKSKKHIDEIGEFGTAVENTRLTQLYNLATKLGMMFFAIALCAICIYSVIFSNARKHGAYGDFFKKETLADIKYHIEKGFIDQSDEVPDDPKGCVIIFFRWGCDDCINVHDAMLEKLKEYDLFKTYFVSSRSDRGQELINQYPIESVPTGIYIYYDMNSGVPYQRKVLNDGTELHEYNLDTLLSVQTYIRCFELPEEYSADAPAELPEKYREDYAQEETAEGDEE